MRSEIENVLLGKRIKNFLVGSARKSVELRGQGQR